MTIERRVLFFNLRQEGFEYVGAVHGRICFSQMEYLFLGSVNLIEGQISGGRVFGNKPYGRLASIKEMPTNKVTRIIDREGKDIIKITGDFSKGDDKFSVLLKTNIFEVFYEIGKQIRMSELGVNGVLSEILFTPEGKQTGNPLSSGKPLEPLTSDDVHFFSDRITKAMEIPYPSHFERLRSSISSIKMAITR